MKIVVTTPTGRVGSRVAQLLVQARHTLGVHGPQDLSYAEVADIVGPAVGRPLTAGEPARVHHHHAHHPGRLGLRC